MEALQPESKDHIHAIGCGCCFHLSTLSTGIISRVNEILSTKSSVVLNEYNNVRAAVLYLVIK